LEEGIGRRNGQVKLKKFQMILSHTFQNRPVACPVRNLETFWFCDNPLFTGLENGISNRRLPPAMPGR